VKGETSEISVVEISLDLILSHGINVDAVFRAEWWNFRSLYRVYFI